MESHPLYVLGALVDALVAAADFGRARQRSIEGLGLQPGSMCCWWGRHRPRPRVFVWVPSPGWTSRLPCWTMRDGRRLGCQSTPRHGCATTHVPDEAFDAIVFHLVLR